MRVSLKDFHDIRDIPEQHELRVPQPSNPELTELPMLHTPSFELKTLL